MNIFIEKVLSNSVIIMEFPPRTPQAEIDRIINAASQTSEKQWATNNRLGIDQ